MDITSDNNTEGKNTVGESWASIDGKIGILTKLDKFLNLLRQHVSSTSNNSEKLHFVSPPRMCTKNLI